MVVFALGATACSSVGSSAIATGPVRRAPRTGAVAIYVIEAPPPGTQELGVVEVHGSQQEGEIETLFPVFARRVAQLGGNGAIIDGVVARFDLVTYMTSESYSYPCGHYTCWGTRTYPVTQEIMTVTMHGRAAHVPKAEGGAP